EVAQAVDDHAGLVFLQPADVDDGEVQVGTDLHLGDRSEAEVGFQIVAEDFHECVADHLPHSRGSARFLHDSDASSSNSSFSVVQPESVASVFDSMKSTSFSSMRSAMACSSVMKLTASRPR